MLCRKQARVYRYGGHGAPRNDASIGIALVNPRTEKSVKEWIPFTNYTIQVYSYAEGTPVNMWVHAAAGAHSILTSIQLKVAELDPALHLF
jgi:hypothetical protein